MLNENKIKVIFDTNIWISYLIGRQLSGLTKFLSTGKIELVFNEQIPLELIQVTKRKKFQKYFKEEKVTELLKLMQFLGKNYQVNNYPDLCRDPKDNFLLGLSEVSEANYLVTGDNDLLVLKSYRSTEIVSPDCFVSIMKNIDQ